MPVLGTGVGLISIFLVCTELELPDVDVQLEAWKISDARSVRYCLAIIWRIL